MTMYEVGVATPLRCMKCNNVSFTGELYNHIFPPWTVAHSYLVVEMLPFIYFGVLHLRSAVKDNYFSFKAKIVNK